MDRSNGYEAVSEEFLERRGSSFTRSTAIGVKEVRKWAKTLPRDSSVIDLGCGPGFTGSCSEPLVYTSQYVTEELEDVGEGHYFDGFKEKIDTHTL